MPALALLTLLAACSGAPEHRRPPRGGEALIIPDRTSIVRVPVAIPLERLRAVIEQQAPRTLWSINEQRDDCVPEERVSVFGHDIRVTPKIGCRVVGQVTRGRVSVSGAGEQLHLRLPIEATVAARDVGGVLKGKTATGSAQVELLVRLSVGPDWKPGADVTLNYDWTVPPGVEFVGHRFTFADAADRKLAPLVKQVQSLIVAELARTDLRAQIEPVWREGFATVSLNKADPPAWMTLAPVRAGVGRYRVAGRELTLDIALAARTRTFLGNRPVAPKATPLPANQALKGDEGLNIFVPVVADYALLEPVVLRALRRLAKDGLIVPGVGPVAARFDKVTIYATGRDRIAVGLDASVRATGPNSARWANADGEIWLTGVPVNACDSQVVTIRDLRVFGRTDSTAADLLLELAQSAPVLARLQAALRNDFAGDYSHLLVAARKAVSDVKLGDAQFHAEIDDVRHGSVRATDRGLYLPVEIRGTGRIGIDR